MTKDELRKLRDSVKATIRKIISEDNTTEAMMQKSIVLYRKLLERCNDNTELVNGLIKLCVEEIEREDYGDLEYMLDAIRNFDKDA